jgi:hypothetical protein
MRPHATRRFDWAQLAMGACALLLPPLALGAAFYSMLAPDDRATRPVEVEAVPPVVRPPSQAPIDLPATAAIPPDAGPQPFSLPAEGSARDQTPTHLAPARGAPVQAVTAPAVAVNPQAYATEGAASPAESPTAVATPKRSTIPHRVQRQPQQQQDPIKTWLQQIGILPPYH